MQRQYESVDRIRDLASNDFAVEHASVIAVEGGDIVMAPYTGAALLGTGFRSAKSSSAALAKFLDRTVVTLELVDPHLYHLDTAFTVLADGTALICEDAFSRDSLRVIRRMGWNELLPISRRPRSILRST